MQHTHVLCDHLTVLLRLRCRSGQTWSPMQSIWAFGVLKLWTIFWARSVEPSDLGTFKRGEVLAPDFIIITRKLFVNYWGLQQSCSPWQNQQICETLLSTKVNFFLRTAENFAVGPLVLFDFTRTNSHTYSDFEIFTQNCETFTAQSCSHSNIFIFTWFIFIIIKYLLKIMWRILSWAYNKYMVPSRRCYFRINLTHTGTYSDSRMCICTRGLLTLLFNFASHFFEQMKSVYFL